MTVAIIGGGIMGLCLGHYLARSGQPVEIFEATPVLGGLAGPMRLPDGTEVDRFYHAILSSDAHLVELCEELGIASELRYRETRMGFFHGGVVHPMNGVLDFLRFPPLGTLDRLRLGLTVAAAQLVRDWRRLEEVSVEAWLVRLGGRRLFESIWRPLLAAKFDGGFDDTPATYIWARLVRMKSTRKGTGQRERAGHLIGGYATLMAAIARRLESGGSTVRLATPVEEIVVEGGRVRGLRVGGELRHFDAVVATLQAPVLHRLLPGLGSVDTAFRAGLARGEYLGIVCPLLVLDRPLTGYWTLNITDARIPFTGIIETTSYIDPSYVGGHHLVYLPKYTAPGSALQSLTDDEVRAQWIGHLTTMFPGFDRSSIRFFPVHRERFVEPVHHLRQSPRIPEVRTPIGGLYLATTSQIYPALTNGESVSRHARAVAATVAADRSRA